MIEYRLFRDTNLNNGYEKYNYYLAPKDDFSYIYNEYSLKVKAYRIVDNVAYSFVFYDLVSQYTSGPFANTLNEYYIDLSCCQNKEQVLRFIDMLKFDVCRSPHYNSNSLTDTFNFKNDIFNTVFNVLTNMLLLDKYD